MSQDKDAMEKESEGEEMNGMEVWIWTGVMMFASWLLMGVFLKIGGHI